MLSRNRKFSTVYGLVLALVLGSASAAFAQYVPLIRKPSDNRDQTNNRQVNDPNNTRVTPQPTNAPGTANPGLAPIPGVQPVQPNGAPQADDKAKTAPAKGVTAFSAAPNLLIGPGDLLEISVYGAPDFDRVPARVGGEGDILLPMIGGVKVQGLRAEDAARLIRGKLSDGGYFNDPQVSVFVREYATQGISVLGEVKNPGVYPVLGQRQLFDAISQAGGVTPRAGNFVTITHRGGKPETVPLTANNSDGNVPIMPGDTILVAKAGIVYVVGDVRMPGGFVMDNGTMSVLQAVSMAQGANSTAQLNNAKLIRKTPQGQQETPLPLKAMLSSKAPDMTLQPDDIVFVPNSAGKSFARRSMEAVIQAATGVAIYRTP
jgi:polysaccharide export outer membrane protein